ncbi:MAG: hypothetical protein RBT59_07060 [Arcobacteraceae bacterium]|jgi:hypothetical protein|nr:hypothetical protein [Arcobacteraceae bacterium]
MKRILGFTSGVIATSVLLSGCVATNQVIEKPQERKVVEIEKPFLKLNDDGNIKEFIPFSKTNVQLHAGVQARLFESAANINPVIFSNKNCLFIGESRLNETTERFDIRFKNAMCTDENNITYASDNIKGYIVGDDDIVGIEGVPSINLNRNLLMRVDLKLLQNFNTEEAKRIENELLRQLVFPIVQLNPGSKGTIVFEGGTFKILDDDIQKLEKIKTNAESGKIALNAIAELKYNKTASMLTENELEQIRTKEPVYTFLAALANLSRDVTHTMITIASIKLSPEEINIENLKNISSADNLLPGLMKYSTRENYLALYYEIQEHFKGKKFTNEEVIQFAEDYYETRNYIGEK